MSEKEDLDNLMNQRIDNMNLSRQPVFHVDDVHKECRTEKESLAKENERLKNALDKIRRRVSQGYYEEDGGIILDWVMQDCKEALSSEGKA